ncbi:hypothetical protein PHSY_005455 [Pseudozyma hubeiensis SY62]|uniref:Uncharacterized protein n=1 Tax=Pseudozyma hubeiensis (strain SY62) TaxID=1305764 RepID=R9P9G2_PSEHS|nr:hypothetical protein PHSY_005455 [Pseudozyma hubeiensis SY62]GAC97867.1 hypothetical protein PHSY_005455 [Pseudozyma hubeiensis SY62]
MGANQTPLLPERGRIDAKRQRYRRRDTKEGEKAWTLITGRIRRDCYRDGGTTKNSSGLLRLFGKACSPRPVAVCRNVRESLLNDTLDIVPSLSLWLSIAAVPNGSFGSTPTIWEQ